MLIGEYDYAIDEKGRLNFPAKFREEMGGTFIVTRWLEECLIAFPKSKWDEVFRALMESGLAAGRVARRFLLSGAVEVTPDKQGRILIPQALRDHAGLVKEVSILGSDPYVEIWNTEAWRRECAKMNNEVVSQAMEKLGI